MKLREQFDMAVFLKQVQRCTGDVYFCTKSGDRLNLKSLLSSYVFSTLKLQKETLQSGWIEGDAKSMSELAVFLE